MMYLEYKNEKYKGCMINIQPEEQVSINRLRNVVCRDLKIQNPNITFCEKNRDILGPDPDPDPDEDVSPDEDVERELEIVDAISPLWDGESSMNVMMLLSRALQTIIDLKGMVLYEDDGEFVDSYEDPFLDDPDNPVNKHDDV